MRYLYRICFKMYTFFPANFFFFSFFFSIIFFLFLVDFSGISDWVESATILAALIVQVEAEKYKTGVIKKIKNNMRGYKKRIQVNPRPGIMMGGITLHILMNGDWYGHTT